MLKYLFPPMMAASLMWAPANAQIQDSISEIPCHATDRLLDHVCANMPEWALVIASPRGAEPHVEIALPALDTPPESAPPLVAAATPPND